MKISDRYSSAVNSSNLKSRPETTWSDTDVLGAYGLAGRSNALAVALTRLFAGDTKAIPEIVQILGDMAFRKARHLRVELADTQAQDIARATLGWYRNGACQPCGGLGYRIIPDTRTLSDKECGQCRGAGKIPFDSQFPVEHRTLAAWLAAQLEREQARAGPAAMRLLAPRFELD